VDNSLDRTPASPVRQTLTYEEFLVWLEDDAIQADEDEFDIVLNSGGHFEADCD
jgi:hypothetical protein